MKHFFSRLSSFRAASSATQGYHYAYTYIGNKIPTRGARIFRYWLHILVFIALCEVTSLFLQRAPVHPIDTLITNAHHEFNRLVDSATTSLEDTAAVYRERRGRHPPPGFDEWYEFAKNRDAVIVEEFWDQIYDDLRPFWAVEPQELRNLTRRVEANTFHFRNQNVTKYGDHFWMDAWKGMMEEFMEKMPELDVNMNIMDEPRVMVPWETVERILHLSEPPKTLLEPQNVVSDFSGGFHEPSDKVLEPHIEFMGGGPLPIWEIFQASCPPDSPAHSGSWHVDLSLEPPELISRYPSPYSYKGFVSNWTMATNPCYQPTLGGLHGHFVQPLRKSTTAQLIPIFSSTKHAANNDIVFPAAMYYANWPLFEVSAEDAKKELPWKEKKTEMIWRGTASGGVNTIDNWWRFQRHRFISMINSTWVAHVEACPQSNPLLNKKGQQVEDCKDWLPRADHSTPESMTDSLPPVFSIPDPRMYPLDIVRGPHKDLAPWTKLWGSDTGFNHLQCSYFDANGTCSYTGMYYSLSGHDMVSMADMVNKFKFLPDIDGNSFSGRYRAFVLSGSVPLKATIFKEWHDKRLVPWLHFVPLDNTFSDLYSVMEYFLGDGLGPTVTIPTSTPTDPNDPNSPKKTITKQRSESSGLLSRLHRWLYGNYKERYWGLPSGSLGHDEEAHEIAENGREWGKKVLRKQDMTIYAYRLMLEWARVADDRREELGWVGDLVNKPKEEKKKGKVLGIF
ncbi:hypothetical protein GQ43DRAFT_438624 [Delitschia confertaspora ATCC 74209]|uniref:Glycosyl transferase CAP10 domain-containing protein n=1 Tax=Delitschia confertaspora ATCC 74209 TaxID=1513339 RepID=A0A9P4JQD2_9PLEO|nr:hypothetical protein GQ43DRAFT_438624 [Delitschia confertaspora ATCC 74209]